MNLSNIKLDAVLATAYALGLQIVGAIILFIVGRWLINFVIRLVNAGLKRQSFDPILAGSIGNALQVLLNIVLVISLLGWFGIQTTTFAELLAAAAFAIGTAWSGLLANFAAGAFIIVRLSTVISLRLAELPGRFSMFLYRVLTQAWCNQDC